MGSGASTVDKNIVIVGGGYAGITLAKALDKRYNVTIIEAREAFNHCVGGLRASVQEQFASQVLIPMDSALKRGKVVKGEVVSWDETSKKVKLASGEEIAYDYLVFATGLSPNILVSVFHQQAVTSCSHSNNGIGLIGYIV